MGIDNKVLTTLIIVGVVSFFIVGLTTIGYALWDFIMRPVTTKRRDK